MSIKKFAVPAAGGIDGFFNAVGYTGNSTSGRAITGFGLDPDFIWIKRRDGTDGHVLVDAVRGTGSTLFSFSSAVEGSFDYISSFDSDGFTIGTTSNATNLSGATYIAWGFKAGSSGSNSDGSITATVSANVNFGFSIIGYTGNGTAGASIGHGLNSAPELVIIKNRGSVYNWPVYNSASGGNANDLLLDSTNALGGTSNWNSTSPTSSIIVLGSGAEVNASGDNYIAYAFHSVSGYSDIGSYTGDGTTSNAVSVGFQPAFVLIKKTNSTSNWSIVDDVRVSGTDSKALYPNLTNAESVSAPIELTSTGFTIKTSGGDFNASGDTYIYLAIAGVN